MRNLLTSILIAFEALKTNKLRSILTMLGIIVGVAAVIAVVALGSAARERIRDQIAGIGSNVIIVMPGSLTRSGIRLGAGFALTLTLADAREVLRQCPSVRQVAPLVRGSAQAIYEGKNWATSIIGTTPEYLDIRNQDLQWGSGFTQHDVNGAARVALLGKTVADNLFEAVDPIGKVIRIRQVPFTVLGVLKPKGQSPAGQDQDDLVVVPLSTAKKKLLGGAMAAPDAVRTIMVQARDSQSIRAAQTQVEQLLRERHRLTPGSGDDFTVRTQDELFSVQEAAARVMSILLASVASVSLIVGGIGIMNIMLVSVNERTREIGLRMAVGARSRNIEEQFLIEAAVLAVTGGGMGVLAGIGVSALLSRLTGWATNTDAEGVMFGFLFSALVGVFFGYYPAHKAASLNPIDALHYE